MPETLERPRGRSFADLSSDEKKTLRRFAAAGLDDREFDEFLEVCTSTGLDPYLRQIWAIRPETSDGERAQWYPLVGRDGLLAKAEEFPDYRGYDSGVVYAQDEFAVVGPGAEATSPSLPLRVRAGVEHTSIGVPKDRGEILGAWCVVERAGRPPRYAFAPLEDYLPPEGSQDANSPWEKKRALMIEKVAISVAHRTALALGRLYVEGEVPDRGQASAAASRKSSPQPDTSEILSTLEVLDATELARLANLVAEIRATEKGLWPDAALRMKLVGRPREDVLREIDVLESDLAAARVRAKDARAKRKPDPAA